MKVTYKGKGLRVLDFDCECRPLSYLGSDYTTGEITAIAACWIVNGKPRGVRAWVLGKDEPRTMLKEFKALYDAADMVTGHFIRGFDLNLVNGGLFDHNLPPLGAKLSHDTKQDMNRIKYMSMSQENMATELGIEAPKVHMSQADWREANRLTPRGLRLTRARVVGDIKQHVAMREELLRRGWLGRPKMWTPTAIAPEYVP